ncbi:His-Xaa-Ser repeat protein HxsA2 [Mycobacterium branderi]|uniref:DUF732 domain-containing protein n=1 Tax=Mycobacterium branderi TaxID=43348 RepID=A0A7I7VZ17_9MYCO|nr:His-Xaa-Ser repeat protein HxsA2 [Mycobacterium branderi]MCV7233434.1 hypothetical protein [Mycobacterium branderi]ORA41487.1 hypothetical protein BST20_05165 [Mycobacterium branderi]BBZ10549.1 hypothetical protein MBRA_07440 [Mycobacterium branderi]
MRETAKILNLASALAALVAPAAAPPIANATYSEGDHSATASGTNEEIEAEAGPNLPRGTELMSFTVHKSSGGVMFPQHGSHASHASHSSHVSHASSSPGYGLPDAPNPIYAPPIVGPPIVGPPVAAPPAVPPTAPATTPPIYTSDITYLACTRASNGLGVNEIASELERVYGVPEDKAVNIAKQALASVLVGGHYCDGYHATEE